MAEARLRASMSRRRRRCFCWEARESEVNWRYSTDEGAARALKAASTDVVDAVGGSIVDEGGMSGVGAKYNLISGSSEGVRK